MFFTPIKTNITKLDNDTAMATSVKTRMFYSAQCKQCFANSLPRMQVQATSRAANTVTKRDQYTLEFGYLANCPKNHFSENKQAGS